MTSADLKKRTFIFAVEAGKLVTALPQTTINRVYSNQLIRSSSSVGANYRAALRAKSKPDFINKLKIVEEEIDESLYFLELLKEFNIDRSEKCKELMIEAEQLLKIIVASIVTIRNRS